MQTEGQKTVTIIEITFSEEEWAMLKRRTDVDNSPAAQYIHDVVMRSLRRKSGKGKKGVQP